jgi:hypothetical protein
MKEEMQVVHLQLLRNLQKRKEMMMRMMKIKNCREL